MSTSARNAPAAIHAAGRQSVCSRTIRKISQAETAISATPSHSPNTIGPATWLASRNSASYPSG
jgi:hypothetical protein